MSHDDPSSLDLFGTLDLFGNTALSSGLGLGVTAFADSPADDPDDDDPAPHSPAPAVPATADAQLLRRAPPKGENFRLAGLRGLARSWRERARDNVAAIRLAASIADEQRPASVDEQAALIRFTGFGASELANGVFRRPGELEFREGWADIGADLENAIDSGDYASLARCTQYAHFTPEYIVRAIWSGLQRLGFRGGRVLEPGIGTGLFPALMPEGLRGVSHVTGIEIDPVTARIARLLQPRAKILNRDFARVELPAHFDLAIGNPPFSDRTVRSDRALRALGLRLHDYFIVKALRALKPGGLAAFVTSSGTMDKADSRARETIAAVADLVCAIRLPAGSFRADAGTDVVVDVLFFRKRQDGEAAADQNWLDLAEVRPPSEDDGGIRVNRWFADHPEMVLGEHALRRGIYGPDETYTCQPRPDVDLEAALATAIQSLPEAIYDGEPEDCGPDADDSADDPASAAALPNGAAAREGSYFIGKNSALMQMVDGHAVTITVRKGRGGDGVSDKHARIIRKLIPIRDAVREVLQLQEFDRPWKPAQVKLRIAWSNFVREFGPINFTTVSTTEDAETGEVRETHRRPNIQPFLDDPDCWLVASIEDYDLETNTARPGPIFTERVIAPPPAPVITSAADALAVVLNERGHVDADHIAELLHRDVADVIDELGQAIFQDPTSGSWQTADAYLSGAVRSKLAAAEAAAALDPAFARNVEALKGVQPADLGPPTSPPVSAHPGFRRPTSSPLSSRRWMPTSASITRPNLHAGRSVRASSAGAPPARPNGAPHRRDAGHLLSDALNSSIPQIFDTVKDGDTERRVLNTVETEAAKEKLQKIKSAFQAWIWSDPDRTDRLARLYNDTFNNIAPRSFNGDHLQLPGASGAFSLYGHQKRAIWRIISAGSTYLAHAVGAGKTLSIAAAIMEQRRLGLINKAMLVVPGHCLAQAAREFLALYPNARILVADETNFVKEKRHRFLSRAATANWDAIIITHSAFRFIVDPVRLRAADDPGRARAYEELLTKVDRDDRLSRKRIERMKEGHKERLEALVHPQGRSAHHLRDRHRPDHRRRGAGVPEAQLRHQHVDAEGRRSQRLAAGLGPLCEVPLHRDEKPGQGARARLRHADHQHARRNVHRAAADGQRSADASAACTNSMPGRRPSATPRPNSNCSRPANTSRSRALPSSSTSPS